MNDTHKDQKYYATVANGQAATVEQTHTFATLKVDTERDSDISYNCTASLKVSVSGEMADKLTTQDAYIKLTGSRTSESAEEKLLGKEVSLSSIVASPDEYENVELAFSLKSEEEPGGTTDTATIKGDVYIVNTQAQQNDSQGSNDISGSSLTITVEVSNLECSIVPSSE